MSPSPRGTLRIEGWLEAAHALAIAAEAQADLTVKHSSSLSILQEGDVYVVISCLLTV